MNNKIEIWVNGLLRCHTTIDNIELATLYFREHNFNAVMTAKALAQDDGAPHQHTVYEWLAIVQEVRNRLWP